MINWQLLPILLLKFLVSTYLMAQARRGAARCVGRRDDVNLDVLITLRDTARTFITFTEGIMYHALVCA